MRSTSENHGMGRLETESANTLRSRLRAALENSP